MLLWLIIRANFYNFYIIVLLNSHNSFCVITYLYYDENTVFHQSLRDTVLEPFYFENLFLLCSGLFIPIAFMNIHHGINKI